MALAKLIDSELEILDTVPDVKLWDVDSVEISNIFSFPEKPIIINLEKLRGVTGIFGANYSGKSNVVKAIVWGLYQHILGGNTGSAKKLVNIYTSSSKGYVRIYLTIDGEKYLIYRGIETTTKKNGETSNTYPVEYKKLITDDDGKTKWVSEISDKKANEKKEVKDIIFKAIGTVEDFTKVCLQTQGGKEDYINQDQQPKNDLVNKYLGLEPFRDRYDYGNKEFNDVKKKQKELGDIVTLQAKVLELESNINKFQLEYDNLVKEKTDSENQKEKVDEKIIELSKSLKQYSPLLNGELDNEADITISIENLKLQIEEEEFKYNNLVSWVSVNFKKELPFNEGETVESLSSELKKESDEFTKEKNKYIEIENWIKINPKKEISSIDGLDLIIQNLNFQIAGLKAKLPTYKGEQCPTCGNVTAQPNQELYNQCLEEITTQTGLLNNYVNAVNQFHGDNAHNNSYELQNSNIQTLRANLTTRKNNKESITQKIALISQSQDILKHNQDVEDNNKLLLLTKNSIDNKNKLIDKLVLNIEKVKQNVESKKHNASIEEEILQLQEEIKKYKFSIYGLSTQVTDKNGDLRIEKNSLENYTSKLSEVTEAEKTYKKYSLYLQSVHRDGIPARIIRRKMPIINNKINSILSTIVNFKIEMSVTTKGDVIENFYFSKDKTDTLPLSFASGSQKFISSIVIKDALHYMSNLIKPSLNIIDEGFGTLDDDKIR